MGADGAMASATMILTILDQNNSVPMRQGLFFP